MMCLRGRGLCILVLDREYVVQLVAFMATSSR